MPAAGRAARVSVSRQRGVVCAVVHPAAGLGPPGPPPPAGRPCQRAGGHRPEHDKGGCTRGGRASRARLERQGRLPPALPCLPVSTTLPCLCMHARPAAIIETRPRVPMLSIADSGALPRGICRPAGAGRGRRGRRHVGAASSGGGLGGSAGRGNSAGAQRQGADCERGRLQGRSERGTQAGRRGAAQPGHGAARGLGGSSGRGSSVGTTMTCRPLLCS